MGFMAKAIAAALTAGILSIAAPYLSPMGQQALGDVIGMVMTFVLGGGIAGVVTYMIPNKK